MNQKMSGQPSSFAKIPSADPMNAKMPDTLNEQDKSRAPGSNRYNDEVEEEGLWQFAMKLPKPDKQSRWYAFRCLACGWICPGTHNISYIRLHFTHSEDCEVACPKVTQNILDRLKAIDETKDVPTMETLQCLFRNRKKMAESVSFTPDTQLEWLTGKVSSATCPKSTSMKDKKARIEPIDSADSPCLGTPTKKMKPQLAPSQSPMMSSYPDADLEHLDQMAKVLRSESVALFRQIDASVVPKPDSFLWRKFVNCMRWLLTCLSFVLSAIVPQYRVLPRHQFPKMAEDTQ